MAYFGDLRHPLQGKVFRQIQRPSRESIEEIARTYTGFIVDRLGKHGVMHHSIKPLNSKMKVCGPAITVLGPDLALRRMAADLAESGDVIVIEAGGSVDYGLFGDGTALKMTLCGVQGIIIDGSTRDANRICEIDFPCFCRGVNLKNYDYPVFPKFGAVNVPIVCGGVAVNPGDLIFGDGDGVLVIPRDFVDSISLNVKTDYLREAMERVSLGQDFRFDVEQDLISRGYQFVDQPFVK
jgi:4-hydroxy-4-methyl-2-oxoglutarate aldolase